MKKLMEIRIVVNGANNEIKTCLKEIFEHALSTNIVDMSFRTMDDFRGHWTEYAIIKSANRVVKPPSDDFIRKAAVQRE